MRRRPRSATVQAANRRTVVRREEDGKSLGFTWIAAILEFARWS
jgi:hypothetical protein